MNSISCLVTLYPNSFKIITECQGFKLVDMEIKKQVKFLFSTMENSEENNQIYILFCGYQNSHPLFKKQQSSLFIRVPSVNVNWIPNKIITLIKYLLHQQKGKSSEIQASTSESANRSKSLRLKFEILILKVSINLIVDREQQYFNLALLSLNDLHMNLLLYDSFNKYRR